MNIRNLQVLSDQNLLFPMKSVANQLQATLHLKLSSYKLLKSEQTLDLYFLRNLHYF